MPGPALREKEWQDCIDAVSETLVNAGYLVGSGSLPPEVPSDFYARLARTAKEVGGRLVVDISGSALRAAGEEGAYLFKPNRTEVEESVGRALRDRDAWNRALGEFVAAGRAEAVVVCWELKAPFSSLEKKVKFCPLATCR